MKHIVHTRPLTRKNGRRGREGRGRERRGEEVRESGIEGRRRRGGRRGGEIMREKSHKCIFTRERRMLYMQSPQQLQHSLKESYWTTKK